MCPNVTRHLLGAVGAGYFQTPVGAVVGAVVLAFWSTLLDLTLSRNGHRPFDGLLVTLFFMASFWSPRFING